MIENIRKEYLRRRRKQLETKQHCKNLIKGINTLAISFVRYSGPFLKSTREERHQIDRRTIKLMTILKALHPRDDIDWLCVRRKVGRGHASVEESVDNLIRHLEDYIKEGKEILITTTRNSPNNTKINKITITRNKMERKTTVWIFQERKGNLKKETVSLLIVVLNNAIRANYFKAKKKKKIRLTK